MAYKKSDYNLFNNVSNPDQVFQKIQLIGKGNFGKVHKVKDIRNNKVYAAKIINLEASQEELEDIREEILVLNSCESNHITRYYASTVHRQNLWIIMEYLDGGSAQSLCKMMAENNKHLEEVYLNIILREVLYGLDYIHSKNKMHRDIKDLNFWRFFTIMSQGTRISLKMGTIFVENRLFPDQPTFCSPKPAWSKFVISAWQALSPTPSKSATLLLGLPTGWLLKLSSSNPTTSNAISGRWASPLSS